MVFSAMVSVTAFVSFLTFVLFQSVSSLQFPCYAIDFSGWDSDEVTPRPSEITPHTLLLPASQ